MRGRWRVWAALGMALALSGAGGCATGRPGKAMGKTGPDGGARTGERWVQAAFFGASGVEATEAELEEAWPGWGAGRVRGGGEAALRRVAGRHGLAAANVALGREGLRRALDEGTSVLVVLPGGRGGRGRLAIPVSWEGGTVETRGAGGAAERWDEEAFFAAWGASGERGMVLIPAARAAKRLPEEREAQLALGEYWLAAGEAERAASAYGASSAGDAAGDARGALGAGAAAGRMGDWRTAAGRFGEALALEPDNPRAMNNAAYAMLRSGEGAEEALRLAEAALAARPGNPAYLETKAGALLALGGKERAEEAAKCLERAWTRARRLPGEDHREILVQLERAWLAAERPDLARQVREARERAFPGVGGSREGAEGERGRAP